MNPRQSEPSWLFEKGEIHQWRNALWVWLDETLGNSQRVATADLLVTAARNAGPQEADELWRRAFWLQAGLVLVARRAPAARRRPQAGLLGVRKCFEARAAISTPQWDAEFAETWEALVEYGLQEIERHATGDHGSAAPEIWNALVREVAAFDRMRDEAWFPRPLAARIEAARLADWRRRAETSAEGSIWRCLQKCDESGAVRCVADLFAREPPWPALAHARVWVDAVLRRTVDEGRPRLTGVLLAVDHEILARGITLELPAAGYVGRSLVREWYFRAFANDLDCAVRWRIARMCWPKLALDEAFFDILDRLAACSRRSDGTIDAVAMHRRLFAEIEIRSSELRNARHENELRALARLMVACSWRPDALSLETEIDFVRKLGRRQCWLELRWLWLALRRLAETNRRDSDDDDGSDPWAEDGPRVRRATNTPALRHFAEAAAALGCEAMLGEVAEVAASEGFDKNDMDATWAAIIMAASRMGARGDGVLWRVFELGRQHHRPFVHASFGLPLVRQAWSRHAERHPLHPVSRAWEAIRSGQSVSVGAIAAVLRDAPLRDLRGAARATEFTGAARIAGRRLINAFAASGDPALEAELDAIVPTVMLRDPEDRLFALGELVTQNNAIFQGTVAQSIRRQLAHEFGIAAIAAQDDASLQAWCRNPLAVAEVFEAIAATMARVEPAVPVQVRNRSLVEWVSENLVRGVHATYEPDLTANYLRGALERLDRAGLGRTNAGTVRHLLRDWVRASIHRTDTEVRSMVRSRAHDAKNRLNRLFRAPIAEGSLDDPWVRHQLEEFRQALLGFIDDTRGRPPPPVTLVRLWPTFVDALEEQAVWMGHTLEIRCSVSDGAAPLQARVAARHLDALKRVAFELLANAHKAVRALPADQRWMEVSLAGNETDGWQVRLTNPRPRMVVLDPFSSHHGLATIDPDLALFVSGTIRRDSHGDPTLSDEDHFVTLLNFPHAKDN